MYVYILCKSNFILFHSFDSKKEIFPIFFYFIFSLIILKKNTNLCFKLILCSIRSLEPKIGKLLKKKKIKIGDTYFDF